MKGRGYLPALFLLEIYMAFIKTCPRCRNATVSDLILDPFRNEYMCDICFYKINPPTFILIRRWYNEYYYSPDLGINIVNGERTLANCKFQIFNHKIFRNIAANARAREIVTYRYRGNYRCRRLKRKYANWPRLMPNCPHMCLLGD